MKTIAAAGPALVATAALTVAVLGAAGKAAADHIPKDGLAYCYADWENEGKQMAIFTRVFEIARDDMASLRAAWGDEARSRSNHPDPAGFVRTDCLFQKHDPSSYWHTESGYDHARVRTMDRFSRMGWEVRQIPWRPVPADLGHPRSAS